MARSLLDVVQVWWRDWRQRTPPALQVIWASYFLACGLITAIALCFAESNGILAFIGFQFSLGLFLVIITSAGSLFEARTNGSLRRLIESPLPASTIVLWQWLANFPTVLVISICPALLAFAVQSQSRFEFFLLLLAIMLVQGALANSLTFALATCLRYSPAAAAISVIVFVAYVAAPFLFAGFGRSVWAFLSPWYAVVTANQQISGGPWAPFAIFWSTGFSMLASLVLLALTCMFFDRCVSRDAGRE